MGSRGQGDCPGRTSGRIKIKQIWRGNHKRCNCYMFALYIVLYVQWSVSLRVHEDARRVVRGVWLQREPPTHYRDVECIYTTHIIFQNIQWLSSIQWWRAAQAHMIAIVKVHTRHVTCSSSRKPTCISTCNCIHNGPLQGHIIFKYLLECTQSKLYVISSM